jgi:hypothetical protein
MARIVVGSSNLTQPLLYPGLGPAMLEQHRRSCDLDYYLHFSVKKQNEKRINLVMFIISKQCHMYFFILGIIDKFEK